MREGIGQRQKIISAKVGSTFNRSASCIYTLGKVSIAGGGGGVKTTFLHINGVLQHRNGVIVYVLRAQSLCSCNEVGNMKFTFFLL